MLSLSSVKAHILPESLDDFDDINPIESSPSSPIDQPTQTMPEFVDDIDPIELSPKSPFDQPTQTMPDMNLPIDIESMNRRRRAIVFRPLFVYRQQQVEKRRLNERQAVLPPRENRRREAARGTASYENRM